MASSLRYSILRHVTVSASHQNLTSLDVQLSSPVRLFSSHDDHLDGDRVITRVLDVIKSFPKVDPSKVTPDVHFQKDLGLDNLDNVELGMALEEEFKLEIPNKEVDKIDSTHLVIEYIHQHPMNG